MCDSCKASPAKRRPARATEAQAPTDDSGVPAGLKPRGRELWSSLGQELSTPSGQLALEVCRIADRLTELDRIIEGKGVLDLMRFRLTPDWWDDNDERHVHVTVTFSSVLSEARGQQLAFGKLLTDLGMKATPKRAGAESTGPKNPLDELAARRA